MESLKRPSALRLTAVLVLLALAACAPQTQGLGTRPIDSLQPLDLAEGRPLHAVATTSLVAETVAIVGAADIELTELLPRGIDPHSYEPTPQDLRAVAKADVVFINGLGLEEFMAELLANAGGRAVVVSLSEGIEPRTLDSEGGADPHVWMDPANVRQWSANAAEALARLDPAHASAYQDRAAGYQARLQSLEAWIDQQVASLPASARRLVTDHDELGYFADRFGFEIVGAVIPAYSPSAEPSAQDIARLEQAIRDLGVRAVFVSSAVNPTLAARVAGDTGVRLVPLYLHSLDGAQGSARTYIALMEYNVRAIVEALR
ncbi:MAG: metal ABC transporter substrate-binding protein [Chloroflexota bacterium]